MRTYKTKEEVEKSKTVTSTVVITLLVIAVVVPMLQYYGCDKISLPSSHTSNIESCACYLFRYTARD